MLLSELDIKKTNPEPKKEELNIYDTAKELDEIENIANNFEREELEKRPSSKLYIPPPKEEPKSPILKPNSQRQKWVQGPAAKNPPPPSNSSNRVDSNLKVIQGNDNKKTPPVFRTSSILEHNTGTSYDKFQKDEDVPVNNTRRNTTTSFISPSVNGTPCGNCNQPVTGEHTIALGKVWHPDHFNCQSCSTPIVGDFFDHDGSLNCRNCANNLFKCSFCTLLIEGQYFIVNNKKFHPTCIDIHPCHKCGNKIEGSEMVAIGKHYHPACFTCVDCGNQLPSKFYNREGSPVCEDCSSKTSSGKKLNCSKCSLPINETYVSYEDRMYHDDCFQCGSCSRVLPIDDFYNVKGKPNCYSCATTSSK
jgi:paxillin